MKRLTMIVAVLACSTGPAWAGSSAGTSAGAATSGAGSSASSRISSGDDKKVVLAARDDAASFVASDGAIRGAQLESALRYLREHHAGMQHASDMQLARAILAL